MKTWLYVINPFFTAVCNNFKKAVHISGVTDAALAARLSDTFFAGQYAIYHPLHQALIAQYNTWKTQGGTQKGATLTFDQLLVLLSPTKINAWDLAVRNVFLPGTPQYVGIFPKGHKPFQLGTKDERVHTVEQLNQSLAAYTSLAAAKTDVNNFHTLLVNARTAQEGQKTQTAGKSDGVTIALTNATTALYALLGACINKFASDPSVIEPLFDLQTIRNHQQLIFTGTMNGNEMESIMQHTFVASDELKLESGATKISFYLAANATDGIAGQTLITLDANSSTTITATQLVNLNNHFLHVINTEAIAGNYRVSLL